MSQKQTILFIAMTGAGREVEHAPFFSGMDQLQDWLFAYAASAYSAEFKCEFASGYEIDMDSKADRWRAAVEWAVDCGREEWAIFEREFPTVGPNGEALSPNAQVTFLDEQYLAQLRAPAPAV